jgi:p-methyltransferase
MPSLGVLYLCNFLASAGLQVEMINFFDFEQERLERLLVGNEVTSVAITTTFYTNAAAVIDIVNFVRARSPKTRIIVGGPHILNICAYYKEDMVRYCLRQMAADYYVWDSQGEATLALLVRALRDGEQINHIPNLLIQKDRELSRTERVPENNDLNRTRIQWRSFPQKSITPTIMTRTARSCAFKCSFCTYPVLAGDLSLMTVDVVEQELRDLQDVGVENIAFIDDTFNVPLSRFKDLCRMIMRNRFTFRWFSYLRCGNIDAEGLDLLSGSGCAGVFLGVESGDAAVLKNMNKKAVAAKYVTGIKGLRERNVPCYASLIIGFPGETVDSVHRSIDMIQESKPTFFHPELYCHYEFSPIGKRAGDFDLKGSGYSWSHATMNWQQAQELLVHTIRNVKEESIYLPTYSFDFWALPYLYGRGLSLEFIRSFLQLTTPVMLQGVTESSSNIDVDEFQLPRLVSRLWAVSGASEVRSYSQ